MGKFTKISDDAFDALQLDAGVLLSSFNPNNPVAPASGDIIATTSGGINVVCQAEYSDFAEDVDNAPNNLKEFKHLDGWTCTMGFTSIKLNATNTIWSLGAADATAGTGVTKIVPRRDVKLTDFKDIWWVGDKANGGAYAVKLINALSTDGLNIQTTKNGKGTNQTTLTGHVSLDNQDVMPMEFYDIEPSEFNVTQNLTNVTSSFTDTTVDNGDSLTATLTAATGYTLSDSNITVKMGGTDISSTAVSSGVVTISSVTGTVVITATATES